MASLTSSHSLNHWSLEESSEGIHCSVSSHYFLSYEHCYSPWITRKRIESGWRHACALPVWGYHSYKIVHKLNKTCYRVLWCLEATPGVENPNEADFELPEQVILSSSYLLTAYVASYSMPLCSCPCLSCLLLLAYLLLLLVPYGVFRICMAAIS